jgi:hypothetical protein
MYINFYFNLIIIFYFILIYFVVFLRSRGSSVSIESDYGLGDRDSIPGRGRGIFCSLCVQTGSGAHPPICTMATGGPFSRGKARPGHDADHSPHLMLRS